MIKSMSKRDISYLPIAMRMPCTLSWGRSPIFPATVTKKRQAANKGLYCERKWQEMKVKIIEILDKWGISC